MKFIRTGLFTAFFLLFITNLFTEDNPSVILFSPQGTVKSVRQVAVKFSEQMVPFGDPKALIDPFDIDSSEKGKSRWADGKNWIYDFDRDLPAGVVCTFKLRSGLKTLSGKEIRGQREFKFSTGGPSVINTSPYKGSQNIDENQIFILMLDADPDRSSVLKNVYFSVEGIQDFIGVKIIEGGEREDIIKSERYDMREQDDIVLVQSKQQFPADTKISLVWGSAVKSKSGVSNTQDQVIRFKTRKVFSAECSCERENAKSDCIPILPIRLNFSAPVPVELAKKITLKVPGSKIRTPKLPENEDSENSVYNVYFDGPFPAGKTLVLDIPGNFKDDSGRQLINPDRFPMSIRTAEFPPLAKFAARFGILELKSDPVLPVTLRNLEPEVNARMLDVGRKSLVGKVIGKIINVSSKGDNFQEWLRIAAGAERETSILKNSNAKEFKIPKPEGPKAFEVVGIPIKDPGLYIVELESTILGASLLGKQEPMYVSTAVLVTNLSVHFKWGRETSIVWVTALNTGDPVANAIISIKDCSGRVLWQGKSGADGTVRVTGLPSSDMLPANCKYNSIGSGLFITAQLEEDISFVFSSWNDGIEPWRFQLPTDYYSDPAVATTVFDRTLLRAGETIHMKHFIRKHEMTGFSMLPKDKIPEKIFITHIGSNDKYEAGLIWDAKGISETAFNIPKEAKLGTYTVILHRNSPSGREYEDLATGEFRVEEFRVPLLKAAIKPPAEPLINPSSVTLDMNIQYLAGGAAGLLPVKLRSEVRDNHLVSFEGYEDFTFGNGFIKEGLSRSGEYPEEGEEDNGVTDSGRIPAVELVLDKAGGARAVIPNIPAADRPREILAEIEFKDPNGELQTVSSKIPAWPSGYVAGIKPDSWALSKDKFKFHAAILDISGKPVANASVRVKMFTRKNYTHRKRLVGGFYAYEYMSEVKELSVLYSGKTDSKGLFIYEAASPVSGNVILQAETEDKNGNKSASHCDVWIGGQGEWWFDVSDNDRIDLLPEKKSYEQGDIAVFQVRMPFRSATALVTVEREGVIESRVEKLSGKEPVIKVPVKGYYAPNCFVSVLAVRGRVGGVQPTALVDMGRPAYKLGIAEIKVGWKYHQLKVNVTPDRKIYNVRDKAKIKIRALTSSGKVPPKGTEVAVAAVDEGLLELMPNRSWDILSSMMGERPYEVQTATAQMQVVGKRHFGLKALPQGGGGGRQTTRELFDTLLLWKGRVLLNDKGEAEIEIPLNDSITGFRIVAVAQGGIGLFGYGYTSIQATQDLMILSGLPPVVREGDRFNAEFTVRNTTNRTIEIEIHANVEGLPDALKTLEVSLQPGEARETGWNISVPAGIEKLSWETSIKEKGGKRSDAIKITQKVIAAIPVRTYQATIFQLDKKYGLSVEKPNEALTGKGGIRVTMKPKLSEGQTAISDYMKNYPYSCMEQQISIAVSLRSEMMWNKAMSALPSYMDEEGLVKYFTSCRLGYPELTSYIIAIGDEAGWEIPQAVKEKMVRALKGFVEGSVNRHPVFESADLSIKKISAIEAISRTGSAASKLLDSIAIEPNLWPTSAVIDWFNILQNMKDIPKREDRIKEAEQIIRSRLNFQGTRMVFSTERSDNLWWLMISSDVNSVRLVLSMLHANKWNDDMPRIVLGAISRQKKGIWDLTLANAWGVLALEKFSRAFETVPVSGETSAWIGGDTKALNWNILPAGKTTFFTWPSGKDDLNIFHKGNGKPWITVQSLAAIPLKEPLSSGYRIKKTIKPIEQKQSGKWTSGDVYRVRLEIEAQADQTWVAVNDPVPAGSTILGKGLSRDSGLLTGNEEKKGHVWLAYEERAFDSFKAYYEYVPKGKWETEYTVRLNQEGSFRLPSTRVEALYSPEMFGELPNENFEIGK